MRKISGLRFPYEWILLLAMLAVYVVPVSLWVVGSLSGLRTPMEGKFAFWTISERTAVLSCAAAAGSVLLAWPLAVLWRFASERSQRVMAIVLVVPLATGLIARNLAWIGLGSNSSMVGSFGLSLLNAENLLYTGKAVVIVMTLMFLPLSFFILIQGTSLVKPEQVHAARLFGLGDFGIIRLLVLPLSQRAAVLAFGFNCAYAVGFFITPRMIGGGGRYNFIGNAILEYVNIGNFEVATRLALQFLVLSAVPAVCILIYALWLRWKTTGR